MGPGLGPGSGPRLGAGRSLFRTLALLDTWHCVSEQRAKGESRRADERVDVLAVEAAVAGAARVDALPETHLPRWQTSAVKEEEEEAEAAAAEAAEAAAAVAQREARGTGRGAPDEAPWWRPREERTEAEHARIKRTAQLMDRLQRRVSQHPLARGLARRGARGLHVAPPPLPPPFRLGEGPSFESAQLQPLAPPPPHEPREPPWWPSREPLLECAALEHGLGRSTPLAAAAAATAASGAAFEVARRRTPDGADADAERLGRLLYDFLAAYSRRAPLRVHDTFAPAGRRGANLGDGAFNFETVAKIFRRRLGQLQERSCLSALIDGWPRDGLLRSSDELSRLLHVEDAWEESWETPRKKSQKPRQKKKKQKAVRWQPGDHFK